MDESHCQGDLADSKDSQDAQLALDDTREQAQAALESGDWGGAEGLLRQALLDDPAWAEGYAGLGVCLARQGNLIEAKRHLLCALKVAPDNVDIYHDLGVVCQELGQYEDALACYSQVVLTWGNDSETFARMGACAEELDRADDAIVLYMQAVQLQPDALEPALGLAKLYLAKRDLERASQVIRASLDHHPGEPLLNYSLGLVLEMQGRYRDALPPFRAVVEADDQHEAAFLHLGCCAQGAGFAQEAEAFLARAISLNPDYLEAIYQLGQVYRESDQLEKAVLTFEQCLRKIDEAEQRQRDWNQEVDETQRVPVLNALGLCHRAAGSDNRARSAWEDSLRLDPDQEEVRAWLSEVKPLYRRTSLTID